MQRYCVYNDKTKVWDVSVPITWSGIKKAPMESLGSYQTKDEAPITWSGIKKAPMESLGSYQTKDEAIFAADEFFAMTSKPKLGGIMARSEADEQTIKALRIRVASLEASLAREKRVAPVGTPPPTEKSVYDDEWYGFPNAGACGRGYMNAVNGFDT